MGPCMEWTMAKTKDGYGTLSVGGRQMYAHRWAYEQALGELEDGLQIDHLCRNRACVNPAHLEMVTHRENLLRGSGWAGLNHRKTHCPQGHEYNEENTAWHKNGHGEKRYRRCRRCYRAQQKKA